MAPGELLVALFSDFTLRTVALGSATLGLFSGAMGTFAVLRRQSLLGDAVAHAALPGIALAFLLTGARTPLPLLLGAALAGWAATMAVLAIVRTTRVPQDTALGLVLSVFFGFGLMLLTYLQKHPGARQAGLDRFLFGQASALLPRDVVTTAAVGAACLGLVAFFWKEFKLVSFDPDLARTLGLPVRRLEILLTTLLVVAIVLGLQTVGVVLMSAMVVAPAAAARQWTDRLGTMVFLAGGIGALAGLAGAVASSTAARVPTGPAIVLAVSTLTLLSLLLAPNRGLLWRWARERRSRHTLRLGGVLHDLAALAAQHPDPGHAHAVSVLKAMAGGRGGVEGSLRELRRNGWAREIRPDQWAITDAGLAEHHQREDQP